MVFRTDGGTARPGRVAPAGRTGAHADRIARDHWADIERLAAALAEKSALNAPCLARPAGSQLLGERGEGRFPAPRWWSGGAAG